MFGFNSLNDPIDEQLINVTYPPFNSKPEEYSFKTPLVDGLLPIEVFSVS